MRHHALSAFSSPLRLTPARTAWAACLWVCLGCSGTDDRAPVEQGGSAVERTLAATGSCKTDEVRECSVFLKERAGVVTCVAGVQVCEDGWWSDCEVDGAGGSAGAANIPGE